MATEDNLRDRAKEIRGAFEPSSVTNEAVGGLLLDIINFFIDYGGSGGEGGKPDARYWSKEELKVLDQYLYVLNDKIKALYADSAGDSELFKGHKWEDHFDQPVRQQDDVIFKSVTQTEDNWHITDKGDTKLRDIIGRVITITDRLMTDNFVAGMTGTGVGVVNKAEVHMDKGVIRKYLEVLALVVAQIFYRGGRQVLSPAGMKINRVEEFDGYWRCYMETEDGQVNQFTVGAQARCNRYGSRQRYWWRLVEAIGVDYIDVSKTDMDAGSMAPAVGDEVVQFGHRTDPYLQWVVMDSSFSDDAGRTIYAGVNSYDLSGKWVLREGVGPDDPTKIGLFTPTGEFSEIIEGLGQDIQDAQTSASDADRKAQEIQDYIDNALRSELDGLHDQADGLVERWPGDYIPLPNNENPTSAANYPANQWTTEEEKQKHVDDTFTKDSGSSEYLGNSWKWSKVNGVWQWVLISDTALTAALAQSARAEETAKRKTRNFIVTPYPPYEAGDTWSQGASGDYMRCVKSRESGSFVESDWEKASKYTDDTKANEALERTRIMADDGIISKEEKATLRDTLAQIKEEITTYQEQATVYGVSINDLLNAYNTLNTFLVNTAKINESGFDTALTVAKKTEYNQAFANYYSERTEFANIVSQKIADGAVGNIQFGMVNLLKGSNVELNRHEYSLGTYFYDTIPEVGKTYTIVMCYTLGENNTHINVYQDYGNNIAATFNTRGNRVIESKSFKFTIENTIYMGFVQFPNGSYGSKIHWAVLVEGNKGPSGWVPALSEQGEEAAKDAVDNLQIGSVNLVSRKMMLAWNEKNKDIAVWGQDADGIYLKWNLDSMISGGLAVPRPDNIPNAVDIFTGSYKLYTQYVISIEGKNEQDKIGAVLFVLYTDGTRSQINVNESNVKSRVDLVTDKGKTIQKIVCYIDSYTNPLIYSLALYEGNKVLTEIPVATEDLQGQSNVNLVDRGKEVTVFPGSGFSNLIALIKPNTVYTVSASNIQSLAGNQTVFLVSLVSKDLNNILSSTDFTTTKKNNILITPNTITQGEYYLLLYAGPSYSTSWSAKYTEVMLVEGFTPPASYSPSPGDVQKEIDDVNNAVINLNDTINGAFKDGIISEAEAKAIASNINILNAEKADIDAYYNKLYANAYLTGTAKTNLASAKTAYNTAHANLINSINTAIADGKTTATEKADVDAKFTAYNNALSAYQTRVGEADKAIQDTIKKVADDAQTSANTAQSAANTAQSTADQAKAGADAANAMLTKWASDEYISPQEKTALRQQKIDIQAEYNGIVTNANRYYISLTSYTTAYNAAISALTKYTATSPENIQVGSDYDNIAAYYTARQTILDSIAAAAKAQADKATGAIGMEGGMMLYKDPEFKVGRNGTTPYGAQNGGGTLVINRIRKSTGQDASNSFSAKMATHVKNEASGSPYSGSDWCLYFKAYGGTSPSHLGGFYFGNPSRANAVFIVKVSAKIPVGYTLKNAHNAHGTGYKQEALTSMAGTGKYETYIFKETCGSTGTFSTVNHLYLSGPVKTGSDPLDENPDNRPLEWFVDYATVMDQTADGYTDIEIVTKDSFAEQLGFTDFEALKANAVKPGNGPLIEAGLVNTKLLTAEALVAVDGFVDKLRTNILTADSIKANMLSVAGFTFQDNQIYGGSDYGVGAGIKMTSRETDRSFKAYKDASNFISMFYNSANDWGLKGVVGGSTLLQLGPTSKIGDFTISDFDNGRWFKSGNEMGLSGRQLFFNLSDRKIYIASHPSESVGGNGIASYFNLGNVTPTLKSGAKCAIYATVPVSRVSDILGGSHALYADHGDVTVKDGFFRGPVIPGDTLISSSTSTTYLTLQQTLVVWNGTSKINMVLPDNAPNGHTVVIHAATGRKANLGVICSNDAKMNYRGKIYSWIDLTNRNSTLKIRKIGGYWFTTYEEEWTSGFGG